MKKKSSTSITASTRSAFVDDSKNSREALRKQVEELEEELRKVEAEKTLIAATLRKAEDASSPLINQNREESRAFLSKLKEAVGKNGASNTFSISDSFIKNHLPRILEVFAKKGYHIDVESDAKTSTRGLSPLNKPEKSEKKTLGILTSDIAPIVKKLNICSAGVVPSYFLAIEHAMDIDKTSP